MASIAKEKKKVNHTDRSADPLGFTTPDSVLSLSPTGIPRGFTITADSYVSLCSRVYTALCFRGSLFAATIPESVFQYYAILLLWRRFADIIFDPAKTGSSIFCTEIARLSYAWILDPLYTYLCGIGNFQDLNGYNRQFMLPVLPTSEEIGGVTYTFGKVNAETHALYEAFPAPGIAALRILADIRYTENKCEENLFWDLPEKLRPSVMELHKSCGKPTKNLLGWAPAQCLTTRQLELLKSWEIDDKFLINNHFASDLNPSLDKLFRGTSNHLPVNDGNIRYENHSLLGSLAQGITVHKYPESFQFDRSTMYCEGNFHASSAYITNDNLTKDAVIAGYRMAKEPIDNRHCWSCYDFNKYTCVPESWIESRNMIYTYGSVHGLNDILCTTGYTTKRVLQNKCIQHTMFVNSKEKWNIYQ